jgi:hypothetical protein
MGLDVYPRYGNSIQQTGIQAGLVLRDLFLHDFASMEIENLNHLSDLNNTYWLNTIWHRRYAIFFGLTQFGNDNAWQHSSCVGG